MKCNAIRNAESESESKSKVRLCALRAAASSVHSESSPRLILILLVSFSFSFSGGARRRSAPREGGEGPPQKRRRRPTHRFRRLTIGKSNLNCATHAQRERGNYSLDSSMASLSAPHRLRLLIASNANAQGTSSPNLRSVDCCALLNGGIHSTVNVRKIDKSRVDERRSRSASEGAPKRGCVSVARRTHWRFSRAL